MDLNIKGKGALVTGASSGLGAACAMALASEGADVVINSRNLEKLEICAKRIKDVTGRKVGLIAGDLTQVKDIETLVHSATKELPPKRIDILVSNTGGPPPGYFLDLPDNNWDDAYELLLNSAIKLTRAVLPTMISNKWGRLIYITSVSVLQPIDDLILSNSFRAGLTGFCKTISNTYGKHGITANTVCPGYTATERLKNIAVSRAKQQGITPEEIMDSFAKLVPLGRVGQPEELAALVAFLASDKAAYISGCSIPVDGGSHRSLL